MEGDLQELLSENAREIEFLDKDIEKKRVEAIDAERNLKAASTPAEVAAAKTALTLANIKLKDAKDNKKDFREGRDYFSSNGSIKNVGRNIEDLEEQKKDKAQEIKTENILRKQAYANSFIFPTRINKEAANKIRTEAKLDSGTKT
jgi:hypothetical protein